MIDTIDRYATTTDKDHTFVTPLIALDYLIHEHKNAVAADEKTVLKEKIDFIFLQLYNKDQTLAEAFYEKNKTALEAISSVKKTIDDFQKRLDQSTIFFQSQPIENAHQLIYLLDYTDENRLAADLTALSLCGIPASQIISSGILHRFFEYHSCELDGVASPIKNFYRLLSLNSSNNSLIKICSKTTAELGDIEIYALTGQRPQNLKKATIAPEICDLSKNINFKTFYQQFGLVFIAEILKNNYKLEELQYWINNYQANSKMLIQLIDENQNQAELLKKISDLLSDATTTTLFNKHLSSYIHIAIYKPSLYRKFFYSEFKQMINKIVERNDENKLTWLHAFLIDEDLTNKWREDILEKIIRIILNNPELVYNLPGLHSNIVPSFRLKINQKIEQEINKILTAHQENIAKLPELKLFNQNTLINLKDKYFPRLRKVRALKKFLRLYSDYTPVAFESFDNDIHALKISILNHYADDVSNRDIFNGLIHLLTQHVYEVIDDFLPPAIYLCVEIMDRSHINSSLTIKVYAFDTIIEWVKHKIDLISENYIEQINTLIQLEKICFKLLHVDSIPLIKDINNLLSKAREAHWVSQYEKMYAENNINWFMSVPDNNKDHAKHFEQWLKNKTFEEKIKIADSFYEFHRNLPDSSLYQANSLSTLKEIFTFISNSFLDEEQIPPKLAIFQPEKIRASTSKNFKLLAKAIVNFEDPVNNWRRNYNRFDVLDLLISDSEESHNKLKIFHRLIYKKNTPISREIFLRNILNNNKSSDCAKKFATLEYLYLLRGLIFPIKDIKNYLNNLNLDARSLDILFNGFVTPEDNLFYALLSTFIDKEEWSSIVKLCLSHLDQYQSCNSRILNDIMDLARKKTLAFSHLRGRSNPILVMGQLPGYKPDRITLIYLEPILNELLLNSKSAEERAWVRQFPDYEINEFKLKGELHKSLEHKYSLAYIKEIFRQPDIALKKSYVTQILTNYPETSREIHDWLTNMCNMPQRFESLTTKPNGHMMDIFKMSQVLLNDYTKRDSCTPALCRLFAGTWHHHVKEVNAFLDITHNEKDPDLMVFRLNALANNASNKNGTLAKTVQFILHSQAKLGLKINDTATPAGPRHSLSGITQA